MKTLNVLMLMAAALSVDFSVAQDPASGQTTERLHTRKDLVRFLRDYITAEETRMVRFLRDYITTEETKVEQIRKWVNTLMVLSEGSQDLYPPINAFKLMKKLNTDWGELESLVLQDMSDVTAHCHRESAASKYSGPNQPIIVPISTPLSLINFAFMIKCELGASSVLSDIKYTDYGCFCGKGGAGKPVDELDTCCQVHDDCYGKVQVDPNCSTWFGILDKAVPYFKSYHYDCDKETGKATCLESNDACQMVLCECDRVAAECFAKAPYNDEYYHMDQSICK